MLSPETDYVCHRTFVVGIAGRNAIAASTGDWFHLENFIIIGVSKRENKTCMKGI
jgi:hypothetical protein